MDSKCNEDRQFWVLYDWVLMGINDSTEFWVLYVVCTCRFRYELFLLSHSLHLVTLYIFTYPEIIFLKFRGAGFSNLFNCIMVKHVIKTSHT